MAQIYRYGRGAMLVEALQGGVGFAVAAAIVLIAEPTATVTLVLAAAAALFLLYFGRAVVRCLTRIELDPQGIRARGPLEVAIPWSELCGLRLDHYTTRSDRSGGWMHLVIRGARGTIRIDSAVEGFAELAAAAYGGAQRRGHVLDERTQRNFRGLGISKHD